MSSADPCWKVRCPDNKQCVVGGNGKPKCACQSERDCPLTVDIVCGSDGISYINECVMKNRACVKDLPIKVKHKGYCGKYEKCRDRQTVALQTHDTRQTDSRI